MSHTMRVLLLIAAVITAIWILGKIRKLKVKMEDAIFWVVFALMLAVMGLFPEIIYWLTGKLGVMSPANLIFLIVIFLLIEKIFTLSIIVSQLEDKITVLSAEIALRTHSADKRLDAYDKAAGIEACNAADSGNSVQGSAEADYKNTEDTAEDKETDTAKNTKRTDSDVRETAGI